MIMASPNTTEIPMPTDHGRREKLLREQYAETERRKLEEERQASQDRTDGLHRRVGQKIVRHAEALRKVRDRQQ